MTIPFVSTRWSRIVRYSTGKSDPTMPTIEVLVNMLDVRDAKVAAPPKMFVSVLKGVRVVSNAIVPKTVNIYPDFDSFQN